MSGGISVLSWQEFVTPADEGRVGAKTLECLAKLGADRTSSNDNQVLWLSRQVENVVRCVISNILDTVELRNVRATTSSNASFRESQDLSIHGDFMASGEFCVSHVDVDTEGRREALG